LLNKKNEKNFPIQETPPEKKETSVTVPFAEKGFCLKEGNEVENQQRTAEHNEKDHRNNGNGKGQKFKPFENNQCLPDQDSAACQSDNVGA
jgi:hypothetical protein